MGAPDSDETVTLEQLASGEAGPEEARRASRLLQDMPALEGLQPILASVSRMLNTSTQPLDMF